MGTTLILYQRSCFVKYQTIQSRGGLNNEEERLATFIEEMETTGDKWTLEQVEDVYGDCTLAEALADRKSSIGTFFDISGKVINRD